MISVLNPIKTIDPASPTAADKRKPGFDRSIRYHRNGLTIIKVRETCIVEAHGTFLCGTISPVGDFEVGNDFEGRDSQ